MSENAYIAPVTGAVQCINDNFTALSSEIITKATKDTLQSLSSVVTALVQDYFIINNQITNNISGSIDNLIENKADKWQTYTKTETDENFVSQTYFGNISGSFADKSDTNTQLDTKVDKVIGKSLIADSEISRLSNVTNYDDTDVKNDITDLQNNKANNAITLSGYGITDAYIDNGTIFLGEKSIIPLTVHQDITGKADKSTTLAGYGITDACTTTEIQSLSGELYNLITNVSAALEDFINTIMSK